MGEQVEPVPLPAGVTREATAPERLVVVWAAASTDVSDLLDALAAAGHLPLRLDPAETAELAEVAGPPALLVVDTDVLDAAALAVLDRLGGASRQTRVCALASERSGSQGLMQAMRRGVTDVLDPTDPAALLEIGRLVAPVDRAQERVLAVGAHPDDVEIGCGATLLRHRSEGHSVSVLTLSRGGVGGAREERRKEATGAAMAMSAELFLADLPDTRIGDVQEAVGLIEGVIAHVRPTVVYVHSQHDHHQDHRAVHEFTVIAARRVPELLCYQSPSSRNGFDPTKFVPVADTIEEKIAVLSRYSSQSTRHYLDPELVVATARYWARQLPHTTYVEPFEVLRSSEGHRSGR
jgi:LmbE family N-acetylglucosaminyl deacetylase